MTTEAQRLIEQITEAVHAPYIRGGGTGWTASVTLAGFAIVAKGKSKAGALEALLDLVSQALADRYATIDGVTPPQTPDAVEGATDADGRSGDQTAEAEIRPLVGACECRCGGSPKGKRSRFLPGHDARLAGAHKRAARQAAAQ